MTEPRATGDLVLVGDVHLDADDPALDSFLGFLDRLGEGSSRIVFLGDLFNLWIGRRELEQSHQVAVLERFDRLRRRGVSIGYVEGNRDYGVGSCYAGDRLDDATDGRLLERHAGRRLVAVHGDLANPDDRQYRRWRRFSRSRPVWALFNLLPRARRIRLAESLERRLRASNREFKSAFPEAAVRRYAASVLGPDDDALVLGHFHVEKELAPAGNTARGRVLALPEWKSSRRHLRVDAAGAIGFVDSE